jgi:hypothetical protein
MNIDDFVALQLKTCEEITWKNTSKNLVEKADLEKAL